MTADAYSHVCTERNCNSAKSIRELCLLAGGRPCSQAVSAQDATLLNTTFKAIIRCGDSRPSPSGRNVTLGAIVDSLGRPLLVRARTYLPLGLDYTPQQSRDCARLSVSSL